MFMVVKFFGGVAHSKYHPSLLKIRFLGAKEERSESAADQIPASVIVARGKSEGGRPQAPCTIVRECGSNKYYYSYQLKYHKL